MDEELKVPLRQQIQKDLDTTQEEHGDKAYKKKLALFRKDYFSTPPTAWVPEPAEGTDNDEIHQSTSTGHPDLNWQDEVPTEGIILNEQQSESALSLGVDSGIAEE